MAARATILGWGPSGLLFLKIVGQYCRLQISASSADEGGSKGTEMDRKWKDCWPAAVWPLDESRLDASSAANILTAHTRKCRISG